MKKIRLTFIEFIVILTLLAVILYIGFPIYKDIECKIENDKNYYWLIDKQECRTYIR